MLDFLFATVILFLEFFSVKLKNKIVFLEKYPISNSWHLVKCQFKIILFEKKLELDANKYVNIVLIFPPNMQYESSKMQ